MKNKIQNLKNRIQLLIKTSNHILKEFFLYSISKTDFVPFIRKQIVTKVATLSSADVLWKLKLHNFLSYS